ncbi:IS4 family transposase [Paenibacillus sp. FSL M7-0420]|uniref:IS4 family transposase n=1 Tax=Paenibacillus sp. FSL M7-0420 TaxID=2921609 RepID=UPI0030FBDA16
MNNNTPFLAVFKQVLTPEEVEMVTGQTENYEDTGTKMTVGVLFDYFIQACYHKWDGFRQSARVGSNYDLPKVHYSTLSGKAGEVPYDIFKRLFQMLVQKCNRQTRRHLNLPKDLLLIDSTTVTAANSRMSWAPYKKFRGGIKLHVAFSHGQHSPVKVVESIARRNDAPFGEVLADKDYLLVQDRAYGKIGRLDQYVQQGQSFVIRLKDNLHLVLPRKLQRPAEGDTKIVRDITCYIGQGKHQSAQRHRVVEFENDRGEVVRVVTDLRKESAHVIAEIYKARWEIEVFFRWVKQHLNVPCLFGNTENAVYSQLFVALTAYVLLKYIFDEIHPKVPVFAKLTLWEFMQYWRIFNLPLEWQVQLNQLRRKEHLGVFVIP